MTTERGNCVLEQSREGRKVGGYACGAYMRIKFGHVTGLCGDGDCAYCRIHVYRFGRVVGLMERF
jgi:hypothetical protein